MKRTPARRRIRFDWGSLERRAVPTTLIALIDSGVDLSSVADSPYYNFAAAYDAYDKLAVAPTAHGLVQDTSLQHGHGSTVADHIIKGIEAAKAQAGAGAVDVQIMPIRDTAPGAISPDTGAVVRGVYWAADHGAAVINLSIRQYGQDLYDLDPSDPYYGFSLSRAIAYARSKNVAVVTAPGNETINVDGFNPYGSYIMPGGAALASHNGLGTPLDNLLVAAAVDPSNKLTPYSNWGPVTVNVGAYTGTGGNAVTSYSAGYASGVAGVIAALTPSLTAAQRLNLIEQTVTPAAQSVGAWSTTGGVINPGNAVAQAIGTINLAGSFNVVGITADTATAPGNLDGSGDSFSASQLGPTVTAAGSVFSLGPAGSVDAIQSAGQFVPLPSGSFGGLRLLGTAVNGNQSGTFKVTYGDGSSASFSRTFADWHSGPVAPGESLAASTTYRNASNGRDLNHNGFNLFTSTLPLDSSRTLRGVTLPSNRNIVLFAAGLTASSPRLAASGGATAVDLGGSFNVVGITADNATAPGNLDGTGHSFSAGLLGPSVISGGTSFHLGPTGSANAVRSVGQTIGLPTGSFAGLRLLAVGVNGTQAGSFTVNYTDGTSATFTQILDDWHVSANAPGESVAASTGYRNASNGRDTFYSGFNLFSYAFGIDPTRTVESLTLPSNGNIAVFAANLISGQGTSVNLAGVYNVVGITADSNPGAGRLDHIDASYSAGLLASTIAAGGVTFTLGPVGAADAVAASGQTVALPAGNYSSLALLGTGVNGTQSGTFTVRYTDGTRVTIVRTFSDWHAGPNVPGESVAVSMPYRNRAGGRDSQAFYLYNYVLPLDPTRTVASVTLPGNANIAVLAITLGS